MKANISVSVASALAMIALAGTTLPGQASTGTEATRIVHLVAGEMEERYVFPDAGQRVAALLRSRLRAGAYRDMRGGALAERLTQDLRAATGDGHLGIEYTANPLPPEDSAATAEMERRDRERYYGPKLNYGVRKTELLQDNVAYLELTVFAPLEWAGPVVTAAMTMVAQADALIIDLRRNGGGHGDTVQWLVSHLFERPRRLSGEYSRVRNVTTERWSLAWVPGPRFTESKPVFILISRRTFSAAEALAYDLQALGRATIIGEASGGGAHPYENVKLDAHYVLGLPMSRSLNPITGGNWQGTGVRPDVTTAADSALAVALRLAQARSGTR